MLLSCSALLFLACSEDSLPPELLGEARCSELKVLAVLPNASLVIFLNDTMRRDYLGIYGGPVATPNFDAFASEGLLFENAATQSPWTKPSIATLFTSLYPSQHGVASAPQLRRTAPGERGLESDVLAGGLVTLAEVLRAAGFRTAAFMSNPWMGKRFGFDQGFEVYDDSFARWGVPGDRVVAAGLEWLKGLEPGERYFLYLHTIDSHRPYGRISLDDIELKLRQYNSSRRLTALEGHQLSGFLKLRNGQPAESAGFLPTTSLVKAAYREGIAEFDRGLGTFLAAARRSESWRRTAVLVTSDHGEALYERGYGNHGGGLYDDEAAVPLAARLPGVSPETGRVECLVGLVDVMPSLCSYFGVDCPGATKGWSFLSSPGDTEVEVRRYLVTEGVMDRPEHRSIRNRHYKLMYEPQGQRDSRDKDTPWSQFAVGTDEAERHDVLEADPRSSLGDQAFRVMRPALFQAVERMAVPDGGTAEVDPELQKRLEALGYME